MGTSDDFPIEKYEEHLPRLRRKEVRARAMTFGSAGASVMELGFFAALPNHPMMAIICSGILAFGAWYWSIVLGDAKRQSRMIKGGSRPNGVWFKLQAEALRREIAQAPQRTEGFADQVADIQAKAEKAAEVEKDQWWRQPGSLWHQTQEFIDSADEVFKAKAQEEENLRIQRRRAERVIAAAEEKKRLVELEVRQKIAEKERRIEATKRWIAQEREWDAFVEDAQVDARARKERGDWHEPPVGIPGAVYAAHRDDEPLSYHPAMSPEVIARMLMSGHMEVEQIRAWGQPEPIFTEAPNRSRCSRGKTIYTDSQAKEVLANLSLVGIWHHYRFERCQQHYHLIRKVR
jgi:hypothetical protein